MDFQDDIEVKKDIERADEIRALKRVWENAEEGRVVKVGYLMICLVNIIVYQYCL